MFLMELSVPSKEPHELSEVKNYLRVDHDQDDSLIRQIYKSARQSIEKYSNVILAPRSLRLIIDSYSQNNIAFPIKPILSVTEISIYSKNNIWNILDQSYYNFVKGEVSYIFIEKKWPTPFIEKNGIRIDFVAGDINLAENYQRLFQAVLQVALYYYQYKDKYSSGEMIEIPSSILQLIHDYKNIRL